MHISVITPSIRPDGLKAAFETLKSVELDGLTWEWLPRLSIPGQKPDLAYQMNQALKEANGELVVFLQDWIQINPRGLQSFWDAYKKYPNTAFTSPLAKVEHLETFYKIADKNDGLTPIGADYLGMLKYDWRPHWKESETMEYHRWEIDWGAAPRQAMVDAGLFDEHFDDGFGWENVELAYKMSKIGIEFRCIANNLAIAWDHDLNTKHPFKDRPNQDLWATKKAVIDLQYGGDSAD